MEAQEHDRRAALQAMERVSSGRLRRAIDELAGFGGRSDGGVARQTLDEADLQARRYLVERAQALGCTVEVDDCANLFFRRPGRTDGPAVATGSHADTQPVGGRLDGAYGVLAGLEVLQALNDAGIQTRQPVEVVVWTNEEGSRFGPGCMGSSAYVDPARLPAYRAVLDADRISFGAAVDRALDALPDLQRRPLRQALASFIELHIEQGPVLENAGVPLGVVGGIQSVRWYRVRVTGIAAHAGTTPMGNRSDAMATAIELAHQLQAEAARYRQQGLRLTLGRWLVSPNSINTIPGEVEFSIDMRCVDAGLLARLDQRLRELIHNQSGAARLALEPIFERPPTQFPPAMTDLVEEACACACEQAGKPPPLRLTSGAFHDAMYLADLCPTAMIFVPSKGGLSHNAAEHTEHEDLVLGARALAYAVTRMAGS